MINFCKANIQLIPFKEIVKPNKHKCIHTKMYILFSSLFTGNRMPDLHGEEVGDLHPGEHGGPQLRDRQV